MIAQNRVRYRALGAELTAVEAEFAELIRAAFAAGRTGPEIAAVAQVSKERTYQIRDGRR